MDEEVRQRIEREAEKHALFNALKHEADAQVGAIMGPLMGENPEFREYGDDVPGVVAPVVNEVNAMDPDAQRDRLVEVDPDRVEALEAEPEADERPLPDLPNAEDVDEVRMRLAPNPNGPWHIGHARMPAVIGTYKERYDGWFVCRFDDTDPETKRPVLDAYDWILDDIDYLGFEPDLVVKASDRVETYYDHGHGLIDAGGAYTCSCAQEAFSELKNAAEACPHRDKPTETSHEEFDRMIDGGFDPGEMVLRVRTDIEHRNPALRDWVAFRQIDTPHPRGAAADYRCWPTLDFQSGIDDHLLGVTHIIRGIDLQDSAKRQRFVYDYFGWEYPEVIHWGHVQVDEYDVKLSTSRIGELVVAGELDGWDDPRAPTIRSLRRRGIKGAALTNAMIELGTSTSNVELSMSTVYAKNRELIDAATDRLFFVRDGVEKLVIGGPDVGEPPVHPEDESRGVRQLSVVDGVLLEPDDVPPNGERVWLKGFGCVRHTRDALEYDPADIDVVREGAVDVVHWVPAADNRHTTLRTMDGDVEGVAEAGLAEYDVDSVVQFERVGFARVDDQAGRTVAYYAHP